MRIRVTNKHYCTEPGEYIGRPSVLGNPFVLRQDGSREEVVDKYRRWLWGKIKEGGPILDELHRLKEQARQCELVLVCWCKRPDKEVACHGDVIKQAIEWLDCKGNAAQTDTATDSPFMFAEFASPEQPVTGAKNTREAEQLCLPGL